MPYTDKQEKAFRAAAHDPKTRRAMGLSQEEADKLSHEATELKKEGKEKASGFIDLEKVFNPVSKAR